MDRNKEVVVGKNHPFRVGSSSFSHATPFKNVNQYLDFLKDAEEET